MEQPLMQDDQQSKPQETGIKKWVGIVARWSFFIFSIIALFMSFGHLHIKFKDVKCKKFYRGNDKVRCTRNLAWLKYNNGLKFDSNAEDWRGVISFVPDVFFDVWTPFVFSIFSLGQCFKGYKVNFITGTWFRTLLYIVVWHLFAIIGYAANWGVLCGLWGILLLGILYLLMTIICLFDGINETHHNTTLQIDVEDIIIMGTNKLGLTNIQPQQSQSQYQQPTAPGNNDVNNPNPTQNNIGTSSQAPPSYQQNSGYQQQGYQQQGYQSSGLDNNYQQQTEYQAFQPPPPVDNQDNRDPPPNYQEHVQGE